MIHATCDTLIDKNDAQADQNQMLIEALLP